jgi:predicted porin
LVDGVWNSVTSGGFSAAGIIMNNGDTTGALNNVLCQTTVSNTSGSIALTPPAANSCVTEATSNNTAWSRRISNSVQYWSPVFAGLQFRLMTALANYQSPGNNQLASGLAKAKEWGGSVTWARGPLSLGLGYDLHQGLRPNTTTATTGSANPKDTAFQLGGKWNFGLGEVGVGYEKLSYGEQAAAGVASTKMDVPAFVVNGRVNAGPGAVWASYSKTSGGKSCTGTLTIGGASCGVEAKMTTVGYDYIMSKRTKMYVAYNKIDNGFKNGAGTNYYYIAGPAGNNANGTASGVQAGTDVTTIGLGMQVVF